MWKQCNVYGLYLDSLDGFLLLCRNWKIWLVHWMGWISWFFLWVSSGEEFQSAGCEKVLLFLSCSRCPTIYQRPLLFRCVILHLPPTFFPTGKALIWTHACSLVILFSLSYSLLGRFIDFIAAKRCELLEEKLTLSNRNWNPELLTPIKMNFSS